MQFVDGKGSLLGQVVYCYWEVNRSHQRSHDRMERIYLRGEVIDETENQVKMRIQSSLPEFNNEIRVLYRRELICRGNGDFRTVADGDPIEMDKWIPVGFWWDKNYGYPTLKP